MKRVAVILVDRANYGRLRPVMQAMQKNPDIELLTVCAGTMLLDRFGKARNLVEKDGFRVDSEVFLEVEGSMTTTMTKSIGLAVIEFTSVLQHLKPDFVLIVGDRYEVMAAAIATVYQNFCLIHIQGGEVSGSIDESTRHAITKLAHYHFPATKRSGKFIEAMGEDPKTIFPIGCPLCDVVHASPKEIPIDTLKKLGVGLEINFNEPYLLVIYHPVTTEAETQEAEMEEVLGAIKELNTQTILLWPNIDAGSDLVSQAIRRFREFNHDFPLHAYKNLEAEFYIPVLNNALCCVGNSSSFVRETSYLGTPVVLVGSRQDGREWSPSVKRVEPLTHKIIEGIEEQIKHGRYKPSNIYGEPGVSEKMSQIIATLKPYRQKRLHYIHRDNPPA